MIKVSEIMTPQPLTITSKANLAEARTLMCEHDIRHLPIVEGGLLTGLITQRDLLAAEESSLLIIDASKRAANEKVVLVDTFMKTSLVTISPNASIRQAALYLQKHKLGCLPVVEKDKIIGIITDSDFVNVAINLLELDEHEAM